MRPVVNLLWVLGMVSFCQCQNVAELASLLPQCAVGSIFVPVFFQLFLADRRTKSTCVLQVLVASPCGFTDIECLCTNEDFLKGSTDCVLKGCTREEAHGMLNGTSHVCNFPRRDRSSTLTKTSVTLTTIASLVAVARLAYQASKIGTGLFWDDGFIVITLGLVVASTIIYEQGAIPNGLGKDVWLVTYQELVRFVRWFYVIEVLYFAAIALLKTSILILFGRVFSQTSVSYMVAGTLVVNGLYGVIFFFVAVFQCKPIIFTWTNVDEDNCLDVVAIIWSHAAISIAVDFWMLALPVWKLRSLQMHWKKKLFAGLMLGTGIFVTVVSIIRLNSILVFTRSINPTWEQYDVALWSVVELNFGIICACMPSLGHMMKRLTPSLMRSTAAYGSRKTHNVNNGHTSVKPTTHSRDSSAFTSTPKIGAGAILQTQSFTVEHEDQERLFPGQDLENNDDLFAMRQLSATTTAHTTPHP